MIEKVSSPSCGINFGAKVNLDLRCRNYYKKSPEFREIVELIKKKVQADEVFIISDRNVHADGTRNIYGQSYHKDGCLRDTRIGTVNEGNFVKFTNYIVPGKPQEFGDLYNNRLYLMS